MSKYLNLSQSILDKCPEMRKLNRVGNLEWISRNIKLTVLERTEVLNYLRSIKRNK
jgi:hypothetical protein